MQYYKFYRKQVKPLEEYEKNFEEISDGLFFYNALD